MMFRRLLATIALLFAAPAAFAADCAITVEANDAMQYDTKRIEVSQGCDTFTVTLEHVGSMARKVMGHNWVLTASADKQGVNQDGMAAGLEQNYLKPDDGRVIAATDVIGGGEETSATFDVGALKADGDYTFFCSFPGHAAVMTGTLAIIE